jgi:hypothetical protein
VEEALAPAPAEESPRAEEESRELSFEPLQPPTPAPTPREPVASPTFDFESLDLESPKPVVQEPLLRRPPPQLEDLVFGEAQAPSEAAADDDAELMVGNVAICAHALRDLPGRGRAARERDGDGRWRRSRPTRCIP